VNTKLPLKVCLAAVSYARMLHLLIKLIYTYHFLLLLSVLLSKPDFVTTRIVVFLCV